MDSNGSGCSPVEDSCQTSNGYSGYTIVDSLLAV